MLLQKVVFASWLISVLLTLLIALRLDSVYASSTAVGELRVSYSKLTHDFQAYALEKGQPVATNTAFTSKTLDSDSSGAEALAATCTLGPCKTGFCPLCWAKNYQNKFNGKCGYTGVAGTCGFANGSAYSCQG